MEELLLHVREELIECQFMNKRLEMLLSKYLNN